MINYQTFYNKYVNKNKENSASPRVFPFGNFALPRSSILHYVPLSQDDVGPPENYPLIAKSERKVPVHHVQQIATMEGKPVPLSTPIAESIRSYHNRNRKLIKTENFKNGTKDPITPFVINYSFASKKLRYPNNLKSQYFRSVNMLNTVIRTAAKLADETEFNQFMFVNMPRSLNKIGFLRMAANNMTAVHYQRFSNYDEVFLFHLWMWCGDQRSQSAFNYLNEEQMKKINIVFVSDGVYTIFNLGSWNSFRKNSIEDTGYPADVFQLRFVKMEMKFLEASKNNETIDEGESDESISEITSTLQDSQAEDDDRETVEDPRESKIASLDINNLDQYLQDRQNETGEDSLPDEDESSVSDKELFQDIPDTEKSVEGDIADSLTEAELEDEINSIDAMLTGNDERSIVGEYEDPVVVSDIPTDYAKASIEVLDAFAEQGTMSAATYKKKVEAAHKFETATVDLDGATVNLKDFITIDKKDLVIPERVEMKDPGAITDKRMLSAKLNYFDSHYIENVMKRDIALACTSMQKAGINISDIKKTTHEDAVTAYEMYTVKYTPIEGQTSSIRFKIPKLNENGVFKVNGREYVMRKQKGDIPIRKVNSSRVALTSYYGKVFIDLVERRQFNYGRWITNKIRSASLDKTNTLVKDSRSGNVFDSTAAVPSLYSILATEFKTFTVVSKEYEIFFYLDYQARQGRFGEQLVMETETSTKMTFIGLYTTAKEKWPVVIDSKNNLYVKRKDSLDELPALEEMIGLNPNDGPVEACELNVLGKTIPVGICLGYEMGLENLLKKLKISYREVMAGTRLNLTKEEHAIRFSDLAIVYNRKDAVASLILNGFNLYADQIGEYSFYQFNNKPVYLNVLESKKITMRYLRKLDMLNKLFVDPITEKLLIEMKEPTTFRDLLVRSAQLLVTRDHPDEVDGSMQRIKGYERMVGAIYSQLSKSVETYYTKGNRSSAAIELHPEAIWMDILTDTAKAPYNELNPIQNLKHHEAVIFSGTGGRSAQSMVKRTRTYHKNDLGVISEATVDSGNVALNVYLSPDANFNNVYGISTPIDSNDPSQLNPTKIYSTSALTFAGVDGDDPKRTNFISVQNDHTIPSTGYEILPVRTGYEQLLAQRSTSTFASSAKGKGTVTYLDNAALIVTYENGKEHRIELGRKYGRDGDLIIPHEILPFVKLGQEVNEGDILSYNSGFFTPDPLNKNNVAYKAGKMLNVVLLESELTIEDSSALTVKAAKAMGVSTTKMRSIVVNFDQEIHRLIKPGTAVDVNDILCIMEDSLTTDSGAFDDAGLEALSRLARQTPKAKYKGIVEKIEVFYNGDIEDMSDSLAELTNKSNAVMYRNSKLVNGKGFTGSVDETYRVDGNPLIVDTAVINIYITKDFSMSVGDKGVFANQLKTTFGEILPYVPVTETGTEIDAVFGGKSVFARIVNSPMALGTANVLLANASKMMAKMYLED